MKRILLISFVSILFCFHGYSQTTWTWTGVSSTSWNDANNWDDGFGSTGVPTSSDDVVFDGNGGSNDCTIDVNISNALGSLSILSGYTGTVTQGTGNILATGTFTIESGTFSGSSSSININSTFTQTGGVFNATGGSTNINNTFTSSGGTFNHNNGTVTFRNNSFTINNSPTFHNLTFGNSNMTGGVTFTIASTLTVNNTLSINVGTLAGLRPITLNGGVINARGNLTLTGPGGAGPTAGGGSTTVILNGTGTQTINGRTTSGEIPLPNLEINSSTARTITFGGGTQSATANGTFTISGSGSVTINTGTIAVKGGVSLTNTGTAGGGTGTILINNTTTSQTITGNSTIGQSILPNLTIVKSTATLTLSNTISVGGAITYTSSGTITNTGSTLAYVGGAQTVLSPTGNFPAYNHLAIGGSGTKTISGTTITTTLLTIQNSDLNVGNIGTNYLDVTNTTSGAVTYTGTGKVIGNLRRAVTTGTTYSYPVGTSGAIQRLDINFSSLGDHSTVNLSFSSSSPGNNVDAGSENDATFDEMLTDGYWIITGNGTTSPTYNLSLFPSGFTNGSNVAFTIMKRVGAGNWQLNGTASNPTNATEDGTPADDGVWADGSIRRTGMTGFSNFGIGGSNDPLPVELDYFNANLIEDYVKLDWATLTENKSSHFIIERSPKMDNFKSIGKIASAGTSSERNEYLFNDMSASHQPSNILYYRLKQVDVDGQSKIYPAKAVDISNIIRESKIKIHPNPARANVTVASFSKEPYDLVIYNPVGEAIYQEHVEKETKINVSGYAKGVYIFKCISATGVINKKVVIE